MKILIATDGSRTGSEAVAFGALLARNLDAKTELLTVAESAREEHWLRERLDDLAAQLGPAEAVEAVVRRGRPADTILHEVEATGADLLVVGARGRSLFRRWILGDTAHRLAHRVRIPLIIVRRSRPQIDKILICTAGGKQGHVDASYGSRIAAATGASIVILHVMSQVAMSRSAGIEQMRRGAAWHQEHGTTEGKHLSELVKVAEEHGVPVEAKIRWGLVVDEILAEARQGDYDLVTVGAHRRQGFQDRLLTDVTEEIISRLDRPVLVVR